MKTNHLLAVPALLIIATLLLAACDDNNNGGAATPTPVESPVVQPTAGDPSPEPTSGAIDGGRDPIEGSIGPFRPGAPPAVLTRVEAAAHDGFDRIAFEFDGETVDYQVAYIDEAIACGSGGVVDVEGDALLEVRFTPAQAHEDSGLPTLGFSALTPGLDAVLEVVSTCDFEGVVVWVVGLSEELDFLATPLDKPLRLALDVAHP